MDFFGLTRSKPEFGEHYLIASNDTMALQRLSGTLTGGFSLKSGMEEQQRLLFSAQGQSGLQMRIGWYGMLGYSRKREQYIHKNQPVGGVLKDDFIDWGDQYPLAGDRIADYLKIGAGGFIGFDFVQATDKFAISFGLTMGLFNLSANVLVNSDTRIDTDAAFTKAPDKIKANYDPNLAMRIGVAF